MLGCTSRWGPIGDTSFTRSTEPECLRDRMFPYRLGGVRKLRLITCTNAVVAEVKSHLHLRRFKAAQIFLKVVVSIAQCFAERHPICGGFGSRSGGVRANHKRGFTHEHDAAKNHLRHSKVANGLCEWLFSRFHQF